MYVRMAERSKALRSGRSLVLQAWVRIPLLTVFFFFYFWLTGERVFYGGGGEGAGGREVALFFFLLVASMSMRANVFCTRQ